MPEPARSFCSRRFMICLDKRLPHACGHRGASYLVHLFGRRARYLRRRDRLGYSAVVVRLSIGFIAWPGSAIVWFGLR
ncbi:hypothetical protein AD428_00010 [Achromobacter sp. DMS1]|nr:hypothetical protein AD428_00010 [Achromobacter sp. DMS1]